MSILQLAPSPAYAVGSTFTIPRRSLARTPETVTATVTRVRRGTSEYIYTLSIDDGLKYGHWRIATESMFRGQIKEAVERGMVRAA